MEKISRTDHVKNEEVGYFKESRMKEISYIKQNGKLSVLVKYCVGTAF